VSLDTGQIGYIPRTYVASYSGLQAFDWFHGRVSKKDVDKALRTPANPRGTFLIRDSERVPGLYRHSAHGLTKTIEVSDNAQFVCIFICPESTKKNNKKYGRHAQRR